MFQCFRAEWGLFFIYGGTIADFLEEGHFPMKRDKLTILVITGDRISTFVLNNCVGSGSSTHDAVGQHMLVVHISSTVAGKYQSCSSLM